MGWRPLRPKRKISLQPRVRLSGRCHLVLPGHILNYNLLGGEGRRMGIVVVRSPKCLRGLLRRLFGLKG